MRGPFWTPITPLTGSFLHAGPHFKRLKSIVGLSGPPGTHEDSARPYVLAHLLLMLLLEPVIDEFEDSPRSAQSA